MPFVQSAQNESPGPPSSPPNKHEGAEGQPRLLPAKRRLSAVKLLSGGALHRRRSKQKERQRREDLESVVSTFRIRRQEQTSENRAKKARGVEATQKEEEILYSENNKRGNSLGVGSSFLMAPGVEEHRELAARHRVIHPQSMFKRCWDIILLLLVVWLMVSVPFQIAFNSDLGGQGLSAVVDIIFIVDIFVTFNTAVFDSRTKRLIAQRSSIAKKYAKGWLFMDLVAAIPIDRVVLGMMVPTESGGVGDNNALKMMKGVRLVRQLRLLKLLRLMRMSKLVRSGSITSTGFAVSRAGSVFKIFRLMFVVLFLAHASCCLWFFLSDTFDSEQPSGFLLSSGTISSRSTLQLYLRSLYHVTAMLIGDQGGVRPGNSTDYVFGVVMMLTGAVTAAVVFGNMAVIVSNNTAAHSKFQQKMEEVYSSMKYLSLPIALQKRIVTFYHYLWEKHRSLDGSTGTFISELSPNLRSEIIIFKRRNMIKNVPLFKHFEPQIVQELVTGMALEIYLPGDYVVRQNECTKGMYFLHSGLCNVIVEGDDGGEETIKSLSRGDAFGESNLLNPKSRRESSVLAAAVCEFCIVTHEKWREIENKWPEARGMLTRASDFSRPSVSSSTPSSRKTTSSCRENFDAEENSHSVDFFVEQGGEDCTEHAKPSNSVEGETLGQMIASGHGKGQDSGSLLVDNECRSANDAVDARLPRDASASGGERLHMRLERIEKMLVHIVNTLPDADPCDGHFAAA